MASHGESLHPRVYRLRASWRLGMCALGGPFIPAGLAGVVYFGTGHEMHSRAQAIAFVVCMLGFAALGALLVASALRTRVVLHADAIESRGLLAPRRLERAQIRGVTVQAQQWRVRLLPNDERLKAVDIPFGLQSDTVLAPWMLALPNFDAAQVERHFGELQEELGDLPAVRAGLSRAVVVARVGNGVALVTAGWAFLAPRPYAPLMALLVALPWFALVLTAVSRGLIGLDQRVHDPRPTLAGLYALPGLALLLRAVLDINLVDWRPLVLPLLAGAAVMTAAAFAVDGQLRKRPPMLLLMLPVAAAYVAGALIEGNALVDGSRPDRHRVQVVDKHTSSGQTTTYYLTLDWTPGRDRDVVVSARLYGAVGRDSAVILWVRAGALGWPWMTVALDE